MPDTGRSTHLWMMLAFITGMIFIFTLVQTIVSVHRVSPANESSPAIPAPYEDRDSGTPAIIPDDISPRYKYGLVFLYFKPEVMISTLTIPA